VQDLESVLRTLQDSMSNMVVSMDFFTQPLNRCRDACKDFSALITESTEHSTDEQVSIGDWLKLRYMGKARSALPTAIMSPASPLAEPRLPFLITAEAFNSAQKYFISSTLQLQRYLHSLNTQAQTAHHRLPPPLVE
jgi:hypothetical protein